MAYTKVDFDSIITDIGGKVDAAKTSGTYAGNENDWDKQLVDRLSRSLDQAAAQNDAANTLIKNTYAEAKKWLDAAEALVKKKGKKMTPIDVGVLENAQRHVAKQAAALSTDSQNLMAALLEFRGGWPGEAKKVVSNPARVDALVARRKQTIDANVQSEALKTRVKEYDTRITSLINVARKLAGQAGADNKTVIAEFDRDVKKALDLANKAAKQPAVEMIVKLDPKKALSPADRKFHQENLASFQALTKNWRGAMKTSEQLMSHFKKITADFAGDDKKARDASLAKAATEAKAAAAKIKVADSLEDKAAKNLKVVLKR